MSPICLFVYKRYDTTQRMLQSLTRCPESADSDLYVFMDGPHTENEKEQVERVRSLFDRLTGFKSINLYKSVNNKGLAQSVIDGVTTILEENDSIIVLEDDLLVAPDFLTFMNEALLKYESRKDIWSISGYTPDIKELGIFNPEGVFLVPRAQCWGWGTWADRWKTVDWNVNDYKQLTKSKQAIQDFNKGGDDLFRTLKMERAGRIESWAIRWAYSASRQHRWTINPIQSKVQNIGLDNSASHVGWHDDRHKVSLYGNPTIIDTDIQPNDILLQAFKRHHDLGIISKIGYFMRLHNLAYNFAKKIF